MNSEKALQHHCVKFGSETIEFSLESRNRSTLSISVSPDLSVAVVAPVGSSLEKVEEKVRKRAPWIIKQRFYFSQFLPAIVRRDYRSGEAFRYLGRQYRLKVLSGSIEAVATDRGILRVTLPTPGNTTRVQELLRDWYRTRARAVFEARLRSCSERFQGVGLPDYTLSVRKMNFRWGSCTKNGLIILNEDLIQVPSHCIDYVICHELSHLKVRNHTPEFFKILSRVMPDWEVRRRRLEKVAL